MATDFLAESRALQEVARELNRVKTIGQARGAAGATLTEISKGYSLAKRVGSIWAAEHMRTPAITKRLDDLRTEIEGEYQRLGANTSALIPAATWSRLRGTISKAYGEIFSLQTQVGDVPTVGGVLRDSIHDLPKTVVAAAKATAGAVVEVVDVATSWIRNLLLLVIVVVVLAIMLGGGLKKKIGL